MKKSYLKITIGLVSLILLLFVINAGINIWIKHKLPNLINEKNDSAYSITYKNINVSLLNFNIKASDIVINPKLALNKPTAKTGIYAKVKLVEVINFQLWSILFSNKIKATSIHISNPEVVLYKKMTKPSTITKALIHRL